MSCPLLQNILPCAPRARIRFFACLLTPAKHISTSLSITCRGRCFFLRYQTNNDRDEFEMILCKLVSEELKRTQSQPSLWLRARTIALEMYLSTVIRQLTALLIFGSFVCDALQTQLIPRQKFSDISALVYSLYKSHCILTSENFGPELPINSHCLIMTPSNHAKKYSTNLNSRLRSFLPLK